MDLSDALRERVPPRLLDPRLDALIGEAIARIRGDLARLAPWSAEEMNSWIDRQAAGEGAEECFRGLKAHFLLIPWFLEQRVRGSIDLKFQRELVYSSINGYYFVRLLDNVADGHSDARLLPLAGLFHSNFQATFSGWFTPNHPFWERFREFWIGMADATVRHGAMRQLSEADFITVSARKIAAVKIPVAAVACHFERPDLLHSWLAVYDRFACSHEMLDDLCDWHEDLDAGRATFLLSEAERRRRPNESVYAWLIRDGLKAGYGKILGWLGEALALARDLDSAMLEEFIQYRYGQVERFWNSLAPHLERLKELAEVLEGPTHAAG